MPDDPMAMGKMRRSGGSNYEPNVPFSIAPDADLTKTRQAVPDQDDLRHRYASALDDLDHGHDQQERRYVFVDDALEAIMAVRDNELEQLKDDALAVVAESTQEVQALRERAEKAEAEVARLRAGLVALDRLDREIESDRECEAERLRVLFLQRCSAIERARHVCGRAKARKNAPGMWLVAEQVLAALDSQGTDRG